MEYSSIVDSLLQLPKFTTKNSFADTKYFMERLGNPQNSFPVVHVAGSNGKGSVCAFLAASLKASGIFGGLFTSPHLTDIRERIQLDLEWIGKEAFSLAYEKVATCISDLCKEGYPHPTFFEYMFAMAMVSFREAGISCAIVETGLGGRLDATNTIERPLLTVITSISLEHTQYLGESIAEIAWEKAGIIKPHVPVVYVGDNRQAAEVIHAVAQEKMAKEWVLWSADSLEIVETETKLRETIETIEAPNPANKRVETIKILLNTGKSIDFFLQCDYDIRCGMHTNRIEHTDEDSFAIADTGYGLQKNSGLQAIEIPFSAPYQAQNAALAYAALLCVQEKLGIPNRAIKQGFVHTKWAGRMEEVLPKVYLDGAHNPGGIAAFLEGVGEIISKPAILVFSMLKEKNVEESVRLICDSGLFRMVIATSLPGQPRALSAEEAADYFRKYKVELLVIDTPKEAFRHALAYQAKEEHIFIVGSLYLVGKISEGSF
ncbi:hypothetical protein FACS1894111_02850 [Clostridia bacterium]|nr:hypothetical protein FACS1894111_02850 [Clostridia bacterium]